MKTLRLAGFTAACIMLTSLAATSSAEPTQMKMTTDIPEPIVIPDRLQTRIGTLEFFDGLPSDDTVRKAYDFLDFQRGVDIFLNEMRAASMVAIRDGLRELGVEGSNRVAIFETLMDSRSLYLTPNTETVYAMSFLDLEADGQP